MNETTELYAYELRRTHTQPTPVDRVRTEALAGRRRQRRHRLASRMRLAADRLDG